MRTLMIAVLALTLSSAAARADDSVTHQEAQRIQAVLNALDCYGGDMETEKRGAVAYEVDDAVCIDGEYDFKLDANFNVVWRGRS